MSYPVNFAATSQVDGPLRLAARRLGALLWPARCLLCGDPGHNDRDLCAACLQAVPWNHAACLRCALPLPSAAPTAAADPGGDSICGACLRRPPRAEATHAAFVYGFPMDRLLPRLKFHNGLAAGRLLAQLAADRFADVLRPEAVIPVPLHASRLRARGYDQALELARPLARRLGVPLRDDVLLRVRATAPQSRLDAKARRSNLRHAFRVRAGAALPAHVALFDDVMTTGATLDGAARALRLAGVARVDAWVCARVP